MPDVANLYSAQNGPTATHRVTLERGFSLTQECAWKWASGRGWLCPCVRFRNANRTGRNVPKAATGKAFTRIARVMIPVTDPLTTAYELVHTEEEAGLL
jgi:hypothetical protein